jgi:hypothetical protein
MIINSTPHFRCANKCLISIFVKIDIFRLQAMQSSSMHRQNLKFDSMLIRNYPQLSKLRTKHIHGLRGNTGGGVPRLRPSREFLEKFKIIFFSRISREIIFEKFEKPDLEYFLNFDLIFHVFRVLC